nr:zinc finger, CCHC-type, retrotransposon Gag domain protein [Tanacetum cinerariifolium]
MQRFLRLAGFLGAAAGTEEEPAKNFQWGLRRSTLNHLMCMSYTDVAQVLSSPGVPLRATPIQFALLVDADTQESVIELLVLASGVVKLAIYRKIARRTPLQRGVTIMVSEPGLETVGSKDLTCEDWMVNTRTDADLSAAVQNALQTLLPQICTEIREEFRPSSGPSDAGGNPPPVTIHTWLERFNKQKPHSFEKATAPVDVENWFSHMEKIFDVMGSFSLTCWVLRSNCRYRGGTGKELSVGSSQVTSDGLGRESVLVCRYLKHYVHVSLRLMFSWTIPFKTLCFFNYALMIHQDYDITSSLRRGALQK